LTAGIEIDKPREK